MKKKWTVGTRGSKLALVQTNLVIERLKALYPECAFTALIIKTTGDSVWDTPLYLIGEKGLFIKEIEEALVPGRDRPRGPQHEGPAHGPRTRVWPWAPSSKGRTPTTRSSP